MAGKENNLLIDRHVLCYKDIAPEKASEFDGIKGHFCGIVTNDLTIVNDVPTALIYMCGDIGSQPHPEKNIVNVIVELSYNFDSCGHNLISIRQVPLNINGAGVYFRNYFGNRDYFNLISHEHEFQSLTESNKASNAFRTGIYLSRVEESPDGEVKFNLLRCSTNLSGPTENFRETDLEVVGLTNAIAHWFFDQPTDMNHVLAQIYHNSSVIVNDKKRAQKARIKEHSDKTKDMPRDGLMGFCTFYKDYLNGQLNGLEKSEADPFDYCYRGVSGLTRLRFRSKVDDPNLVKQFDIVLYPNSLFLMSLESNRLYTHEIVPSALPIEKIPLRMGYVIRCSKTKAVFKDGKTYINYGSEMKALKEPTDDDIAKLKAMYYQENSTTSMIDYGETNFSLNKGDYTKPLV